MNGFEPLAHSPRGDVPAQPYAEHVTKVWRRAVENARNAARYYSGDWENFVEWVGSGAAYHDLGKLDAANQAVLRRPTREPLPVVHDDAGVAALDRLGRTESAVLVAAHHAGLFSREAEMAKGDLIFRCADVAEHVDRHLDAYLATHNSVDCPWYGKVDPSPLQKGGFTRRVALSCLVDADHSDTARHYGNETRPPDIRVRWEERLASLDQYIDSLPKGNGERECQRNALRRRMYRACRDAPVAPPLRTCDAPVGTGKTTAVMAHLLNVAAKKGLRHIFVVLPYTNIISQAVDVYRKALVLEGERAEEVVAEHHHRADFSDLDLRQLATLWKAPIIVTTAVQFFETLGSHEPARLRKLHELPGSAVFVDEMHASIPSHLWPQVWKWLETWTSQWGGHLVLASGSLPRFWALPGYRDLIVSNGSETVPHVPDLVCDNHLREKLHRVEQQRICYQRRPEKAGALNCSQLINFLLSKPGPR